ncbi:hypothetical protein [Spirochaeta isovalerica]|uniref:Uncharacterized protein n=1 Tax=Spirochaeta isovalerica TaxID=150 RepID=A0A841R8W0_9SPIO|nr:hypothetical protein [Spirochaeta isovalerica]MBB6479617.1 hypothetical protein [Spirochaeta isovalerica]
MEHTELMNIVVEKKFKDIELAIHPNDGEDLDLYTRDLQMDLYAGQSIEKLNQGEGQIGKADFHLLNECPMGTILVSESLSIKLNFPEEAVIIRNKDKMYLAYKEF